MKKLIFGSAISLFTALAVAAPKCTDLVYNGTFPTTKARTIILCKNGFAVGYSKDKKTLLWVAERIDSNTNYHINERSSFKKDEKIPADKQASNSDYVGTGYDKGHMVPFEDMSYSTQSAYDSMLFTNIVPQNPSNNRGGWKSLEAYARKLSKYGTIYVVSGPIFEGKTDYIGNKIPIPTKLFKVIINPDGKTSKTFILPNVPVSAYETKQYIFTRAAIVVVDPTPNATLRDVQ